MWILTIRSPYSEPREFALPIGRSTIGRKPENDIVIADNSASRTHAEFEYDPDHGVVVLRDLGSTNGTFVNSERLSEPYHLQPGDQIRIGQHLMRVATRDVNETEAAAAFPETRPLTLELVLEAVEQHAVLLYEVASRLNTIADLNKALQEVSRIMQTALGADKCAVVPAENFGRLAYMGFPTTIARQAIEQRLVVAIPDTSVKTDPILSPSTLLMQIRSVMCIPVMIGEEVAGLIYIYKTNRSKRLFTEQDLRLAIAISHQAALSIQRARLLEKAQQLEQWATVDSLTGLDNRRQFVRLAEREFQRARRFHRPMSVLLLDIDGFKQINEIHGRAAGDAVLQTVAIRLQNTLRDIDLVARYGGDEFVALLLECDLPVAEVVAERCRRKAAEGPVGTPFGLVSVTVSVAVAALAHYHTDVTLLLNEVDAALDMDKHGERHHA